MKEYWADRTASGTEVRVFTGERTYALPLRTELINPWAEAFDWGHCRLGAEQLAVALLADHLGDDREAVALHEDITVRVVAGLPHSGWTLTTQQLEAAVDAARRGTIPY